MSESVAYGLIGCGEIAVDTSEAILDSQLARVVHCMDVKERLAGDLAAKHDARSTARVEELLADGEVEAVIISTPHYLHAPLTVQAAAAGKHVLTEKPIACNLTEADEMIAACAEANVKLCVLHPMRLGFPSVRGRELVAAGAIGEVVAVKMDFMNYKAETYWTGGFSGRVQTDWRIKRDKAGGGCLMTNLVHNLDSMVAILDLAPQRIYAEYATLCTQVEVEDFVSFVMRLEGGAIVSADCSSAAVGERPLCDRIYGKKGQIAMNFRGIKVFLIEPFEDLEPWKWIDLPGPDDFPSPRKAVVEGFSRAIRDGAEVPISGEQGRRALEIVRGAYLSMERGAPVEFPVQE